MSSKLLVIFGRRIISVILSATIIFAIFLIAESLLGGYRDLQFTPLSSYSPSLSSISMLLASIPWIPFMFIILGIGIVTSFIALSKTASKAIVIFSIVILVLGVIFSFFIPRCDNEACLIVGGIESLILISLWLIAGGILPTLYNIAFPAIQTKVFSQKYWLTLIIFTLTFSVFMVVSNMQNIFQAHTQITQTHAQANKIALNPYFKIYNPTYLPQGTSGLGDEEISEVKIMQTKISRSNIVDPGTLGYWINEKYNAIYDKRLYTYNNVNSLAIDQVIIEAPITALEFRQNDLQEINDYPTPQPLMQSESVLTIAGHPAVDYVYPNYSNGKQIAGTHILFIYFDTGTRVSIYGDRYHAILSLNELIKIASSLQLQHQ
ncbi:MAG TPA: hypothetical protein VMR41_03825 [Patescibacteria group bacterium]|nr:hypothetical protein [Patescibacteria group bacterium]